MKDKIKVPIQYRQFEIRAIDEEKRTVELTFSSESEVETFFGKEILDHSKGAVNMERLQNGAAFLLNHDREQQLGVVEDAYIGKDRKGHATVRFSMSKFADEIFNDVKDKIRRLISVGYRVYEAVLEKESEKGNTYRVTKWMPLEISLTSIPKDISVGIARQDGEDLNVLNILQRGENMKNKATPQNPPLAPVAPAAPPVAPAADPPVDREQIISDTRQNETARISEIMEMGQSFNMVKEAQEAIKTPKTAAEFGKEVMTKLKDERHIDTQVANLGLSDPEIKNYRLGNAIRAILTGDMSQAGLEMDASRAIEKLTGKTSKGFFIPHEVLHREITTAAGGTGLIATEQLPQNFIEALRNRTKVIGLGAQTISGLVGDIAIPKQSGVATAYWVAEGGDVTDSESAYTTLPMAPKTVGAATPYSRQMLLQSNPSIDTLVMNDLATVLALAFDLAAIAGTGTGNQPTGVLSTNGIGSVIGTTLGWAGVVEFETDVNAANADIASMAYLTAAVIGGILKTREKAANTARFLAENKEVNGYPLAISNQVPAATMIFGVWSQIVIALWGGLDIMVDTATNAKSGGVVLRAFQSADIGVRHAGAFSASINID